MVQTIVGKLGSRKMGGEMMTDQVGVYALSKVVLGLGWRNAETNLTLPGHREQDDGM